MKIRYAGPRDCARQMTRGGVKRCPFRSPSPSVGWDICCPGCGFTRPYLTDKHGFVEREVVHEESGLRTAELVSAASSPICDLCKKQMVIADGDISSLP